MQTRVFRIIEGAPGALGIMARLVDRISVSRGCSVPDTEDQRRWLSDFARRHHDVDSLGRLFGG